MAIILDIKMSEDDRHQSIVGIGTQGVNSLVFFASIALLFPLKSEIRWDVYKMVGTDASHISIFSMLLILEMWYTFQRYLVAQKALVLIVAPVMLEFIFPFPYNYGEFRSLAISFHVANVFLFIWMSTTPFFGAYGARKESKPLFCIVISGLLLQIITSAVEIVFYSRFLYSNMGLYTFGKSSYANSVAVNIFWSLLTLIAALLCLNNFGKGLLAHRNVLVINYR